MKALERVWVSILVFSNIFSEKKQFRQAGCTVKINVAIDINK
jgi:hypothetical protein